MKILILTAIPILLSTEAFARLAPPSRSAGREQSVLARVTAYWASGGGGSDRYTRKHKSATGMRLRTGHCAVDPKKIPYGSRVIFPDGTALAAVDTGTAVKNRKAARKLGRTTYERNAIVVDRFFETKRQALSWASKNPPFMPVRVILPKPLPSKMIVRKAIPVNKSSIASRPVPLRSTIMASNSSPLRVR